MSWARRLLCLAVLSVAQPLAVEAGGFAPARSTQAALSDALAPRRIAVVIGVDTYDDVSWPPLKHAVSDARALSQVLSDAGAFDEVLLLDSPEQTSRARLLAELRRVGRDLSPDDTLLIYFSGHGTVDIGLGGAPVYYLVASDTGQQSLADTGVELGTLLEFIDKLPARRKATVFDSCFSGEGRSQVRPEVRGHLDDVGLPWLNPPGSMDRSDALLMATGLGGAAQEDDGLGHGVFTWALLQALGARRDDADVDGDGAVTAWEAHDLARALVVERTAGAQAPEAYFRVSGRADVLLVGRHDATGPEVARIYAYSGAGGLALNVDGRTRGAFPRTVTVEPGRHQVQVLSASGASVAAAPMRLRPAEVYEVNSLVATLRRPSWSVGLMAGGGAQLRGPGSLLWGRGGPTTALSLARRGRGGALPGYAGLEVGLAPGQRAVGSAAVEVGLRPAFGWFDVGAGWVVQLSHVAQGSGGDTRLDQPWWVPEMGPSLHQGVVFADGWEAYASQRLLAFQGQPLQGEGVTPAFNLRAQLWLGVRHGF